MTAAAEFGLDESYRRVAPDVVLGGSPLRLFRLTPAGQRVADALERGTPLPANHAALTDRLLDAGALLPVPRGGTTDAVTLVIPAWRRTPELTATQDVTSIIVVDDASPEPLTVAAATVIRLARNGGPAAARNAGLAEVATPLVAFVDADVELHDGWLAPLLAHFADERVALVAPRVLTAPGGSPTVDAFEHLAGSLDLGGRPGRVAAGSRVSYVPAAALVCRTQALQEIGGFDESLRLGEDVDLVWRLAEAGWRCRYEPAVTVRHLARPDLRAWLRQQYGYGTSAAPLERRHPGTLAPLRISGWSLAAWGLVAARRPLAAAVLTAGTAVALQRKLPDVPPVDAANLAGRGTFAAGEQIAGATSRTWWPMALAALAWRPARLPVVLLLAAPRVIAVARSRPPRPGRFAAMHLLADVAYGAGVWRGALRARSVAALRPDLANWPPRARRDGVPRA